MNYPIESLAIVAPILFLVLMIVVPLIGVFAGWKRAAYWGGGTFFFFIVGVIVWKTSSTGIVSGLVKLIANLLKQWSITPTTKLVASLAAPVFFLLVMIVATLLLLINYYAWFKRVSGIKKDVKAKKEFKAAKKAAKQSGKLVANVKTPKGVEGWTATQFTTKGKVINKACGGVGMALLLAPSSITFTQAVMYTTTSTATRANNAFCSRLYNGLEKLGSVFNWMSYYGESDTAIDFDSVLSALTLTNKKITFEHPDPEAEEKTPTKSVIEALGTITAGGVDKIVKVGTAQSSKPLGTQLQSLEEPINQLARNWNKLIEQARTEVTTIFQSRNITEMLESVVKALMKQEEALDPTEILNAYGENSVFKQIVQQVKDGYKTQNPTITIHVEDEEHVTTSITITKLASITVTPEAFNNIKKGFLGGFNTTQLDSEKLALFDTALTDIISMIFASSAQK